MAMRTIVGVAVAKSLHRQRRKNNQLRRPQRNRLQQRQKSHPLQQPNLPLRSHRRLEAKPSHSLHHRLVVKTNPQAKRKPRRPNDQHLLRKRSSQQLLPKSLGPSHPKMNPPAGMTMTHLPVTRLQAKLLTETTRPRQQARRQFL